MESFHPIAVAYGELEHQDREGVGRERGEGERRGRGGEGGEKRHKLLVHAPALHCLQPVPATSQESIQL